MAAPKRMQLWVVNIVSFVLIFLLAVTGLINRLVLPRGGGRGWWPVEVRHLLVDVHAGLAMPFLLAIGIHLWLHAASIKANLGRSGWTGR